MSRIRVLCVDDHALVRGGIVRIIALHPDITVVAEGSTGEEAVDQFLRHKPDVTLIDLQMPKMNGLQAITAIREREPEAKIVVLSMYDGIESIHRALEAGAMGYLLKDAVPEELIPTIREVYAGRRSLSSTVEARLEARMRQPTLTLREVQVLELLAKGMRNKEIAGELAISGETARAHVRSIFVKLQVHDRTAALAEALRRGIVYLDS